MTKPGGGGGSKRARTLLALAAACGGCALMPRELNLSPLWFHRLDDDGGLLEMDLLWPIFHYERTADGGDDFRIRPLWRRVTEPEHEAVEHQFLWPLGRSRSDPVETRQRLFPLWSWRWHVDNDGLWDVDWYLLFPLVWGGQNERGDENYFAFLPFYADIPQFLSYDRFRTLLFPLWVSLDKEGHHHDLVLWPLIGWSSCAEGGHSWFRILPLYGHDIEPGRHERYFLMWPILIWGFEEQDTDDPVWNVWLWPFLGLRKSQKVDGWSFFWPLFEKTDREDAFYRLNLFWPFFHYYWVRWKDEATEWWLWPLIGHATSDHLDNWSFLWPLIWWRRYQDADGKTDAEWVLPLFWHVREDMTDGRQTDWLKLWPLVHRDVRHDAEGRLAKGDWSVLSPIPWRDNNAAGFEELYGFLWQIAYGRQRDVDDSSFDLAARIWTTRTRQQRTTTSVPFLFNCEDGADGTTLRLFQFLPIRIGGPRGAAAMSVLSRTGGAVQARIDSAGFVVDLLLRTATSLRFLPRRLRFTLDMAYNAGVRALPVTMVVAAFAGAILAMQTGIELRRFGDTGVLGTITALSMCREMGPFITGVILAATVGSSMAAELGTMKVSDEVTALEVMSVDPVNYLVLPRVVALAIMCPALTALSDLIGIFGGSIVAMQNLGVSQARFWNSAREALEAADMLLPKEVYVGLFKALVFGIAVSVVSCAAGLRASGGALGVGLAVQTAVRNSVILIIVLGFITTWFFYFLGG